MNDVSYVPIWLYLYHIGDDLDSWLNRVPLEDGPILNRRHVLFGLCSLFPEIRGDEAEIRYFLSLVEAFEQQWGPLSLETLLNVAHAHAPVQDSSLSVLVPPPTLGETDRPESMLAGMAGLVTKDEELLRFVLTTLGATESEPAREALLPYLGSANAWARWSSALWLGHLREPQALPVLRRMLTDYWPLNKRFSTRFGVQAFAGEWQDRVPEVLWRWGDSRFAVDLRQALVKVVQSEQTDWAPPPGPLPESIAPDSVWARYYRGLEEWTSYEHQLVYGLGRLGAFGALAGVETPVGIYNASGGDIVSEDTVSIYNESGSHSTSKECGDMSTNGRFHLSNHGAWEHAKRFRGNLWRVHACCGYLEPAFRDSFTIEGAPYYLVGATDYSRFDEVPEFDQAVQQLLGDQFGLDQVVSQEAMQDYERAGYLWRTLGYYALVAKIVDDNTHA